MRIQKLEEMEKGWFIGNFTPTALQTKDCEAAIKHYPAGTKENFHYHRIATEITVIISGTAEMNGQTLTAGDIVVLEPGEGTDFSALTDTVTAVVKLPSAPDDKYFTR